MNTEDVKVKKKSFLSPIITYSYTLNMELKLFSETSVGIY
jgi:hypothetical protein